MPTLDGPIQLSNIFKPKIWGRKDPAPIFANPDNAKPRLRSCAAREELIGEVWITDDASRFLNGPLAGMTLGEAAEKYKEELLGKTWKESRFPILAKYIFTSQWLSVQVHPDDAYARVHDAGNVGKCEMWYIVRADPQAEILLGMKPGISRGNLMQAFKRGLSKRLLHDFHPKDGEAIFVPPGTAHSLGPGLVVFEVEENSDLTYRLDDFGRVGLDGKPRPLHLSKGVDVIRLEAPPIRDLPRLEFRESFGSRRYVLACPYFALEELTLRKTASFASALERVEVFSMMAGGGRLENQVGWFGCRTGDTWLVPPGVGTYRLVPASEMRLLKFYVPDLAKDFEHPLAERGVAPEVISKIVFT